MTISAVPPRLIDANEFWDTYAGREPTYELVAGIPVMTPFEDFENTAAIGWLTHLLIATFGRRYQCAPHARLHLPAADGGPDTIRVPDLVVRERAARAPSRGDVSGVVLVVEVVSPASTATDWIDKRREYAAAGIEHYLIVDVRGPVPLVWLLSGPGGAPATYPDPGGDGGAVTFTIGGTTMTVTSQDIADAL